MKTFVCQSDAIVDSSTLSPITTTTIISNPCPTTRRWEYFANACYLLVTYLSNDVIIYFQIQNNYYWPEAQANCLQNGGNLTSIHSQDENDFIAGN
jgi:hypothetical protein